MYSDSDLNIRTRWKCFFHFWWKNNIFNAYVYVQGKSLYMFNSICLLYWQVQNLTKNIIILFFIRKDNLIDCLFLRIGYGDKQNRDMVI